jgi:hypothetical protein
LGHPDAARWHYIGAGGGGNSWAASRGLTATIAAAVVKIVGISDEAASFLGKFF